MKKVCLAIALCCITTIALSQPRVNGKGPIKIEKISQVITDPAGWCYDKTLKKWCGYYGLLWMNYKNNEYKPIQTSTANKVSLAGPRVCQLRNISTIQTKRTKIDSTTIYLLYFSSWYVNYDYPAINEGAHYYKQYDVYLLSDSSFNMLWNLDTGINAIPIINHIAYNKDWFLKNEKSMLMALNDAEYLTPICSKYGEKSRVYEYVWYVKKEDDKTIRFVAPFNIKSDINGNSDFSQEYFEVNAATFNKLKIQ